jgi:hypothetical protein
VYNSGVRTTDTMSQRDPEWGEDGEIDLFGGVMFLWRARYLALVFAILGAVIAFAIVRLQPPSYRTSTNIFVAIPLVLRDSVADPPDVDAMDRLAKSEAIQDAVRAAVADGRTDTRSRISNFRTVVDHSLTDVRPSLSSLTLIVTAADAELARRAADAWADLVVKEESQRASTTRASTLAFLTERYKLAMSRLLEKEKALDAAKHVYGDAAAATAEVENAKANFIRAGKRLDEAETVTANRDSAIRRGSPAAPASAVVTSTRKIVAAGAAIGLGLGLFIAWMRTRLRAA